MERCSMPAILATLLFLSLLLPGAARACSVCGCGDPLVLAGDARPLKHNLRLALELDSLTASAASDGVPQGRESVVQQTLRPVLVYSPWDSLNLVLQAPVMRKDWKLTTPTMTQEIDHAGLGDLDVGTRWFVFERRNFDTLTRQNLALSLGSTLPTGPDDAVVLDGTRFDQHAQLGSGAFGPYVGALYAFHRDPWNFFLSATGRMHTVNTYHYQFGDELLWSARAQYRIIDPVAVVLGVDGRYAGRDREDGQLQPDTGGLLLTAVPGLMVDVYQNLWLHAVVQIPFFSHLFGQQSFGPVYSAILQYSLM